MTDVLLQRKWFVVWERMVIAWQTENDHFSDGDSNRSQIFWRVPDEVVRARNEVLCALKMPKRVDERVFVLLFLEDEYAWCVLQ